MLQAWWSANVDARREISLLASVVGLVFVALSLAASDVPLAPGLGLLVAVCGPVIGAAAGGYAAHRSHGPRRALPWAAGYGVSTCALVAGMFATAALVRPAVQAFPASGEAWAGLFVGGCLVGFVGALLWERDARRRRLSAWLLASVWLILGGAVVGLDRGPWAGLAAVAFALGVVLLLRALVGAASFNARPSGPLWARRPRPDDRGRHGMP